MQVILCMLFCQIFKTVALNFETVVAIQSIFKECYYILIEHKHKANCQN